MRIRDLDLTSHDEIAAWHAVLRDGYTRGRPPVWWSGLDAELFRLANPAPMRERITLVAVEEGEVVAAADLVLPTQENAELATVELAVRPDLQGVGRGSSLAEAVLDRLRQRGRKVVEVEVYGLPGESFEQAPAGRFAAKFGVAPGNVETRYLMQLPTSHDGTRPSTGEEVEVVGWVGPTPARYAAELLILRQQMEEDVPRGELTREPAALDLERLRTNQERLTQQGWTSVTSLVLVSGHAAGYTELLVHGDSPVIVQEDTLVLPQHRGHRYGELLKLVNLERLEQVRGDRTLIQTFTADSNTAMRATNAKFGFGAADVLFECEGRISR